MNAILMILQLIFAIILLIVAVRMMIRMIRNNRRWKVMEPVVIEQIEKSVGQKILFKTLQRALPSSASNPQAAIWLWIACTADNVIFLVRDDFTEEGEGNAVVSFKQDASLLRLNKTLTQLEMKIKDSSEVIQLFLLLNTSHYEALARYIPVKRNSGNR